MSLDRVLATTGRALITAGVVVLLFVGYQLWGTGLQEAQAQDALEAEFEDLLATQGTVAPGAADDTAAAPSTTAPGPVTPGDPAVPVNPPLESFSDETLTAALFPAAGSVVARIEMPSIGVDKLVVEGVEADDLRRGPGRYRSSPKPGFEGNAAIAGHRTTYGQPFHDLDRLAPGDRITVTTLLGTFVYEVMSPEEAFGERLAEVAEVLPAAVVVAPRDTWVLGEFGDDRLTLTACHPKFSARQRIVVTARLLQPALVPPAADVPAGAPEEIGFVEDPSATVSAATSDALGSEGLQGESEAIVPAILLGLGALTAYLVVLAWGRSWRRLPAYAIGAGPVLVALWLCFEQVDRLLPAY